VIRIARFLFASAALVYLFHSVPVGDVSAVLRQAQPAWMVGAFLAAMLVQVFMAKRLRILTDAYGLGFGTLDVLGINLATRFYGLFLPGGGATATAVRVVRLARGQRKYAESLAAVALDRVITTATMCLLGVVFGLIASRPGESVWLVVMALGFVGLGVPVFWLRAARSRGAAARDVAGPRQDVATGGAAGRLSSFTRALSGTSAVSEHGWIWVVGASFLGQLAGIVEYALAARALGIDLGFVALGWVRAVMLLAAVLPISVAGLGLREGAAMLMLPHYGVGKDAALALSLLVFALGHLGVGAVGGLIEAFRKGG
jgi:uncharacterized protein (TIRG00374 family)